MWTVADEIRKARVEAGLEQGELAERIGVSRPTISRWENGHSEPTVSQFRAIAQATRASWLTVGHLRRRDDLAVIDDEGQLEFAYIERPHLCAM